MHNHIDKKLKSPAKVLVYVSIHGAHLFPSGLDLSLYKRLLCYTLLTSVVDVQ